MDAATLGRAMGNSLSAARYAQLAPAFNAAMIQAGCTTVNRAAMWCAQLGHESSGLRYMNEIADGSAYEGRVSLGNTQPGDGRRFKGHGPIQITGRSNHAAVSKWAYAKGYVPSPTYFLDHPEQLGDDRYGFLGPVWYWTVARPRINGMCDAGDITGVTRQINGGTNGLADRQVRWNKCRGIGTALLPIGGLGPAPVAPAPPPEPPRRRSRRTPDVLYFKSPEPAPGTAKKDWPTILVPFNFDPIGGWGGQCVLKVDHAGRGGWIKTAKWWIRDKNLWSANRPIHFEQLHPVGPNGSERFPGYGWETAPPVGADFIEITTSCPDGLVLRIDYQK